MCSGDISFSCFWLIFIFKMLSSCHLQNAFIYFTSSKHYRVKEGSHSYLHFTIEETKASTDLATCSCLLTSGIISFSIFLIETDRCCMCVGNWNYWVFKNSVSLLTTEEKNRIRALWGLKGIGESWMSVILGHLGVKEQAECREGATSPQGRGYCVGFCKSNSHKISVIR